MHLVSSPQTLSYAHVLRMCSMGETAHAQNVRVGKGLGDKTIMHPALTEIQLVFVIIISNSLFDITGHSDK